MADFKNVIEQVIPLLDDCCEYSNDLFNIAYGVDENFLYGTGVSISSILLNNNDIKFHFHIFTDTFNQDQEKLFSMLSKQYKTPITIYLLNTDILQKLPTNKLWSNAMYFRLIISDYFFEKLDKFLYLDADIVCQSNLSELQQMTIDNHIAIVVTDRDEALWKKRAVELKTPEINNGYFNSGVMLINVNMWREENITKKTLDLLSTEESKKIFSYYDQDALNITLAGKVKFIDKRYNSQFSINYELKKDNKPTINNNAILIHYIGPTKPWHSWSEYKSTEAFIHAKNNSPWVNLPFLLPKTSMQYRYAAKHMFNNRHKCKGIKYLLLYFLSKIR